MMSLEHAASTSRGIQSLPQSESDKHPVLFKTGRISILVNRAITDELMNQISKTTVKFFTRGSSRCFVVKTKSVDEVHLECAVSFKESRNCQLTQNNLRRLINGCFLKGNPDKHCVEITLHAVDDGDTSIFARLRAKEASGQWFTLYRQGDTTPPQPGGTLTETGVARVGPGVAPPVIVDPVARAGLGVDRPAAAAGSSGVHSVAVEFTARLFHSRLFPACRPRRSGDISLLCRTGGVRTIASPPRPGGGRPERL